MATPELIDLIQRNLEQDGILNKIRAQLLSSVVNILNGNNENKQPKDAITTFLETEQGHLCFQIVADLLSMLKMSATLSVFLGECGMEYSNKARLNISDSIGVSLTDNQPIMLSILENRASNPKSTPSPSQSSKSEEKSAPTFFSSPIAEEKVNLQSAEKEKEKEKEKDGSKFGLGEKQHHSHHQDKLHSQALKPVSSSRHRKGHGELESSIESDLEASTSSISSTTSIGSGKGGKGLTPLPLSVASHGKGKDPLIQLPSANSSGLKHLSPLAPLGHNPLPPTTFSTMQDRLSIPPTIKPVENTLLKKGPPPTLDKLNSNSGGNLEHSFDDERGALSPYDGNKKAREPPTDEFDQSFPESIQSASFEESSRASLDDSERVMSTKNSAMSGKNALTKVEVTSKFPEKTEADPSKGPNKANVMQSTAQVTRSTKGWDDTPENDLSTDLQVDTTYVSEYPESFEESLASENQESPQLTKKTQQIKPESTIPPLKTIDDLISDDEDENEDGKDPDYPETTPTRHDDFDEVRSSRADSIDTISRQIPTSKNSREAFGLQQNPINKKSNDLLSPVEGDESDDGDGDGDEVYGQLDESIQHDDDEDNPSHSAILDESGEHVHEDDQQELNQSHRSNQEDEDDYRQITQSSTIKKSLFNPPNTQISTTNNPNNRSKRSDEDEDDYFDDDDFEHDDADDAGDEKNKKASHLSGGGGGGDNDEDEGSYVESLEEEIEEAEDDEDNGDEHDFSCGGASSGDEDMLNRKDNNEKKSSSSLPSSSSLNYQTRNAGTSRTTGAIEQPGKKVSSGVMKYDHNSSDDDEADPYVPTSRRVSETQQQQQQQEKKTFAKIDENSDDEDFYPTKKTPTGIGSSGGSGGGVARGGGSLFQQKKPQTKNNHDDHNDSGDGSHDESDHEDVPETGSASDFSAGHSDDGESFLNEQSLDPDHKGRGGESNDFSMSEQEISGSHILDDGFDYTTNALPPTRRYGR